MAIWFLFSSGLPRIGTLRDGDDAYGDEELQFCSTASSSAHKNCVDVNLSRSKIRSSSLVSTNSPRSVLRPSSRPTVAGDCHRRRRWLLLLLRQLQHLPLFSFALFGCCRSYIAVVVIAAAAAAAGDDDIAVAPPMLPLPVMPLLLLIRMMTIGNDDNRPISSTLLLLLSRFRWLLLLPFQWRRWLLIAAAASATRSCQPSGDI